MSWLHVAEFQFQLAKLYIIIFLNICEKMRTNNNNNQVKSNKQDYNPIKKRHVAGILPSPSLRLSLVFFFSFWISTWSIVVTRSYGKSKRNLQNPLRFSFNPCFLLSRDRDSSFSFNRSHSGSLPLWHLFPSNSWRQFAQMHVMV